MSVYYVTATGDCPTENITCHPLFYYTSNTIDWPSNVTLIFLPGEHIMTEPLVMSNLSRAIISGSDRNGSVLHIWSRPIITCYNEAVRENSFEISSITELYIQGLKINCTSRLSLFAISKLSLHYVLAYGFSLGLDRANKTYTDDSNIAISMSEFIHEILLFVAKLTLFVTHSILNFCLFSSESTNGDIELKNVSFLEGYTFLYCHFSCEIILTDVIIDSAYYPGLFVNIGYGSLLLTNVTIANGRLEGLRVYGSNGKVLLDNVTISNNRGGGMVLFYVQLVFFNHPSTISNNYSPTNGGGLNIGLENIGIDGNTAVYFINNTAQGKGGAIYQSSSVKYLTGCTFSRHFTAIFAGNHAVTAGNNIYGGTYWNCYADTQYIHVKNNFNSIINCSNSPTLQKFQKPLSLYVTSEAVGVCLCSEDKLTINYHDRIISHQLYPGQFITLPLVTVGVCGGISPAVLVTDFDGGIIVSLETINQETEKQCKNFTYQIKQRWPNSTNGKIKLGMEEKLELPDNSSLIVDITLLPCPHGLALSNGQCECNSVISSVSSGRCDVNEMPHPISKSSNSWLYYNTQYDCTVGYVNCPFDYCTSSTISFSLDDPDIQCANNRSGILCGECQQGLSLMLGSNKCGQCSNKYISLILPFIVAGFIFVAFLLVSNMTVSVGSINGLLFYANVMKLNESDNGISSIPVLSQFIAWLNLDLGIETCFFNGLDGYWKAWLQYCFSFALIALLILCCKLSTKLAHCLGRNVVAVLSTLIFMAHSKLLLAIRNSLMLSVIECGGRKSYVWSVDGNIHYLGHKHIYLFILSLVVMLTGLLYTITIFSSQWMQRLSGRYCRSSWDPFYRLKPFLDAYTGPYKDKYRYWTGLLLIIRLLLTTVFSYTTGTIPIINNYITVFIAGLLIHLLAREVYRNKILNILELFYMANLCITGLSTALINQFGWNIGTTTVITALSVSLSMTAFLITVVVYLYIEMKKFCHSIQCHETREEPLLANVSDGSYIRDDDNLPVINERETLIFH